MAIRSTDVANTSRQNINDCTQTTTTSVANLSDRNVQDSGNAGHQSNHQQADLITGRGWFRRLFTRAAGARALTGLLSLGAAGLLVCSSTGCTMTSGVCRAFGDNHLVDDFMVNYRNKAMAEKAWHCQKHRFCNHKHSKEFKQGFCDGFMAVAEGGNGCAPAVAPQQYWGWRYQSAQGNGAVNAWFEGYPMGVAAAEQAGIGEWSQLRTMGGMGPGNMNAGAMPAVGAANPFYGDPNMGAPNAVPMQPMIQGQPLMESAPVNGSPVPMGSPGSAPDYQFDSFDDSLGNKPIFDSTDSVAALEEASSDKANGANSSDAGVTIADMVNVADSIGNEGSSAADAVIAGLPGVSDSSATNESGEVSMSIGDEDLEAMFGSDAGDLSLEEDGLPFSFE